MISTFFLIKIFGLSGLFNPDLRQYRIKSALFTSHNPDFSAHPRCCVLKYTDWSLEKITSFQTQRKGTHDHQRSLEQACATFVFHWRTIFDF